MINNTILTQRKPVLNAPKLSTGGESSKLHSTI